VEIEMAAYSLLTGNLQRILPLFGPCVGPFFGRSVGMFKGLQALPVKPFWEEQGLF
jgi:hypothetical protein